MTVNTPGYQPGTSWAVELESWKMADLGEPGRTCPWIPLGFYLVVVGRVLL
jgi:hypothetical protein